MKKMTPQQKIVIAWIKVGGTADGWQEWQRVSPTMRREALAEHFELSYRTICTYIKELREQEAKV